MTECAATLQGLSEEDVQIIIDFEEEQTRRGNFDLIFPMAQNVQYYSQFFEQQRSGNELLWRYLINSTPLQSGAGSST